MLGASVALVGPVAAGLAVVVAVGAVGGHRRARRRRLERERDRCVPELVDLFAIAASAGLPVAASLAAVAPRAPVPVRGAMAAAEVRRARGLPIDRCLAELADELGPDGAGLIDALRRSAATGAPLSAALAEVSVAARELRRGRAEEAARRLPVSMLVPLAGCILPAAVLLAVVPVVAVSIAALAR